MEKRDSLWCSMLIAHYGEEGGWLCYSRGVRSVSWQKFNLIRDDVGLENGS